MRVFLSWSGTASRSVAEALGEWLPKVIQGVEPFISAKDIDKGSNWTVELARELEAAQFGIICLAPDNLFSPWLNYEAGAITKSVDSRVCPVLFHVEKQEVQAPMGQLQLTNIELEDFILLVNSLNKAAGNPITTSAVREAVQVWWHLLEEKLADIEVPEAATDDGKNVAKEPVAPVPEVTEMFEELLRHMRSLDSRVRSLEPPKRAVNRSEVFLGRSVGFDYIKHKIEELRLDGVVAMAEMGNLRVKLDMDGAIPKEFASAVKTVARAEGIEIHVRTNDEAGLWSRLGYEPSQQED